MKLDWAQLIILGITKLVIPNTITQLGNYCFADNILLESVEINSRTISWGEFNGCTNLKNVVISNQTKSISYMVFKGCTNLTAITYEGTQDEWNSISKHTYWLENSSLEKVICSDGEIDLK